MDNGWWPPASGWQRFGWAWRRSFAVCRVFALPRGVVMRGLLQTKTIPWSEIAKMSGGPQTSGAAGAMGATTVIVTRSRPGVVEPEHVELNVLGGYGVSPARSTPAERAITDLTAHLEHWRGRQAATD